MKDVYRQSCCQAVSPSNQVMTPSCQPPQQNFALAMAYVIMQPWEQPYDLKTGLCRGTVFPSLDKPFMGRGAVRRG